MDVLDSIMVTRLGEMVKMYLKDGAILECSSVEIFDVKDGSFEVDGCFLDGGCEDGLIIARDEIEKIEVIK